MTQQLTKSILRGVPRLCSTVCCAARRRNTLPQITKCYNSSSSQILSRSTILLQDGLDIRELPLVIRRMNAREFPFSHVFYSGDDLRPVTEEDKQFKLHLQECNTLEDILKLLEVPGEKVTANSAAYALQRLCQLREGCGDGFDSFIKKAVFNELCETATKEIESLDTDTLTTLVKCYLNSDNTGEVFIQKVNQEVEKRVGDGLFSISELCTLITILCEHIKGDHAIVNNMWIHLGNRFQEINHESISQVYATLRNISHEYRYLFGVVDKQFERCWYKLNADDMSAIVKAMTILNHDNLTPLKVIGRWIALNGHDLQNLALLRDLMTMYLHFSYSDNNFIRSLELFLPGKISRLDKTLVSMVMEYCRRRRFYSSKIFNAVALDFEQNGHDYEPHEIVYCLRPFGQLNYIPKNATQMFSVVEEVLSERFNDIDAAAMIELLTSFSYIGRLPINFVNNVFTPHFMSRLQSSPDADTRRKASFHLQLLRSALLLESPRPVSFVNWHVLGKATTTIAGRWHKFHMDVGRTLVGLLRSKTVLKQSETPRHIAYFIDYEICVDSDGQVIDQRDQNKEPHKNLAIVTVMPEHCIVNTKRLLGEQAMKMRHLQLMGYTVIPIRYEDFTWQCGGQNEKDRLLRTKLQKHVNFTTPRQGNS